LVAAAVCSVWFALSMPVVLKMMREHPAAREKPAGKTIFQLTISEMSRTLCNLKSYPEASKYLLATMLAQFGGPAMITYVSTYLPSQLLITSGIQVSAVALSVLVVGVGAARVLALLLQRAKISFRLVWVVVLTLNILIGALVPVLAREPTFTSYVIVVVLAGGLGAVAISWFYSVAWPGFLSLVPSDEAAAHAGLFAFLNGVTNVVALAINTAIVQATNDHALAWGVTITPVCFLSLLTILTVKFDKGKADAGRAGASATVAGIFTSSASAGAPSTA